jgi:hypothetical protein
MILLPPGRRCCTFLLTFSTSCATVCGVSFFYGIRCGSVQPSTPLSPISPGGAFALVIFSALVHPLPVCCGSSVCTPLPRSPGGSAYLCSLLLCLSCYPAWSIVSSFGRGPPGFVPLTVLRLSWQGVVSVAFRGVVICLVSPVRVSAARAPGCYQGVLPWTFLHPSFKGVLLVAF